jgi:hypothetical protein
VKQIESHHVKNNTMDSEKSPNSTPLSETSQNIEETVAAPGIKHLPPQFQPATCYQPNST